MSFSCTTLETGNCTSLSAGGSDESKLPSVTLKLLYFSYSYLLSIKSVCAPTLFVHTVPVESGRGRRSAAFRQGPMGRNACYIRKKGDGGATLDRLTEGPLRVNTQIKTDNEHKTFQVASNELCCLVWLVTRVRCTEEELGQFSFDLLNWFLLDNRMVDGYVPGAPPLQCLSHSQRTQLAQVTDSSHEVHARLNIVSNFSSLFSSLNL